MNPAWTNLSAKFSLYPPPLVEDPDRFYRSGVQQAFYNNLPSPGGLSASGGEGLEPAPYLIRGEGVVVIGFHSYFSHPHLTSPVKGEGVLLKFWQAGQSRAPFDGAS